jgi:uncharacterized protein (DUF1697 family)
MPGGDLLMSRRLLSWGGAPNRRCAVSVPSRIALLRGINVGGCNRLVMAELRDLCEAFGWVDVRTHLQSGNVLFHAEATPEACETALEEALGRRLGISVPALVRGAAPWRAYVDANPFRLESASDPSRVLLALSKRTPAPDAEQRLQERARSGERVVSVEDALWIHFPEGSGHSAITPAVLDRCMGSPVTTRNARTVETLDRLAGPQAKHSAAQFPRGRANTPGHRGSGSQVHE